MSELDPGHVEELLATEWTEERWDRTANNLLAAGALWATLIKEEMRCEVVTVDGQATNSLYVWFDFLKSRYKVTVTLDPEEDG